MTVKELKGLLEGFEDETEVGFAYNYGDHCRTMVVANIKYGDTGPVKHSDYHSMNRLVDDDDNEYGEKQMLILSETRLL